MKKLVLVITSLVLMAAVLAGCFGGTEAFTFQDLTMDVPKGLNDVSGESDYKDFDFALINAKLCIVGMEEAFSTLENGENMTTMDYANAVINANSISSIAVTRSDDRYVYFTYEASTSGISFKYLAGCFKGQDGFWLVQIYAPVADFELETFLGYLDTVQLG